MFTESSIDSKKWGCLGERRVQSTRDIVGGMSLVLGIYPAINWELVMVLWTSAYKTKHYKPQYKNISGYAFIKFFLLSKHCTLMP